MRHHCVRGMRAQWYLPHTTGCWFCFTISLLMASLCMGQTPRVYRDHVTPHWFGAKNDWFWYRNDLPGGRREFIRVDAAGGWRAVAFDHARAAAALGTLLMREVSAERLPVDSLEFAEDRQTVRLAGPDGAWTLNLKSYELTPVTTNTKDAQDGAAQLSPLPAIHPSRASDESTEITFVSELPEAVELFWVDAEGHRQSYGTLDPGARRAQHTFAGHVWVVQRAGRPIAAFEAGADHARAVISDRMPRLAREGQAASRRRAPDNTRAFVASPNGRWEAFVRDGSLWVRDAHTHEERALSTDGSERETYHVDVYRDRAIGLNYRKPEAPATLPEVYWSPDSKHLVAIRTRTVAGRTVNYVQSSPADQLQPQLHAYPYLKAGDEIPIRKPCLFDVEAGKPIALDESLFDNPWDISGIRWSSDSSRFTFLYNQRGHQALRVIAVDANTGKAQAIIDEHSDTFIDYSGKMLLEYLDESHEIIWMSERDGWNHLYLYDADSGRVKNAITHGDWVVRGVDRIDREHRQVWFRAGGIRPGQDPYFLHYARVNFDGSGLVILTEGAGNHAVQFSPDRRYLIDTWSRVDLPPVTELRSADNGRLICKLEEADASEVLAARHRFPEPFVAKGRDGQTDIYGVIFRPADFDSARKYPVIENIYAGPQAAYVPKAFRATYPPQQLADHGFIVVQIDGMGTSFRTRAFHDVCWKNLGDAGFPDRIAWMKAAAGKHPEMDLSRVGIYGTSAGGQNALGGLLTHGDFYTCGVADSGCHDNRMDKIWWNEQWMGWPVGPEYAKQSNVTNAHLLRGPVLLMVGEDDENVDPATTMQVVNALIKADRDFDLLVMPNHGHGVLGTAYGRRRMIEFFEKHLLHPARP